MHGGLAADHREVADEAERDSSRRLVGERPVAGRMGAGVRGLRVQERASLALVATTHSELARQAHDKSQAVLKITHFRFAHDPGPIERRVPQHEPREGLDEPRLEIVLCEGCEQDLAGVFRRPMARAQVGEPGVSQTCDISRERRGIESGRQLLPRTRKRCRREVVKLGSSAG